MAKSKDKTAPAATEKEEIPDAPKAGETPLEFLTSMALVLVTGLFIITFNLQAFEIPSSSMENTLLIGDHVFVDRVTVAPPSSWAGKIMPYRDIKDDDIIVFLSPSEAGLFVVKRIMGVPGDHIHLRDGVVYRNGKALDEPYVVRGGSYGPYRDNFPSIPPSEYNQVTPEWTNELPKNLQGGDVVVPPGNYFAMGDNRDVSYDSRFWGFIPRANIIGRPIFVYWSFNTPAHQYEKKLMSERIGFLFHVVLHFFDETRWKRTFHFVR